MSARDQDPPNNRRNENASTPSDRIDLQHFRTADGPLYAGPFHDTLAKFYGTGNAVDGEWPVTISDLELAETVVYGLPSELKALVKNHEILLKRPFRYIDFQSRTQLFYKGLPCKTSSSQCPAGNLAQSTSAPVTCVPREETIWRVKLFLDSQGRCHHCKKRCGSVPGSCPNSLTHVFAPSFSGAGKPKQAPAGRAPAKVSVLAIANDTLCPNLEAASFAAINEELRLTCEEQSRPAKLARMAASELTSDAAIRFILGCRATE
ncbi:hypothetical protein PCASD_00070 [Puccinia coronata f. sp. avenae]|uniref:Uncharacterized protein n=1 Tax=Puccinia coronata f. sp. avenae TaxID=200324 RepID=A0A2N5VQT1_9BASI|nr:hypothetical protein PCASD_00070 [Puccinia coronata f. sp. avenae]